MPSQPNQHDEREPTSLYKSSEIWQTFSIDVSYQGKSSQIREAKPSLRIVRSTIKLFRLLR
jgi:hypothetical protein